MSRVKNVVWYLLGEKNFKRNPQSRILVPLKALGIHLNISDEHPHPCYVSLFQALGQWGLSNAAGRLLPAPSYFFSPDPARPAPAFSIDPTDREPGTGYVMWAFPPLQRQFTYTAGWRQGEEFRMPTEQATTWSTRLERTTKCFIFLVTARVNIIKA